MLRLCCTGCVSCVSCVLESESLATSEAVGHGAAVLLDQHLGDGHALVEVLKLALGLAAQQVAVAGTPTHDLACASDVETLVGTLVGLEPVVLALGVGIGLALDVEGARGERGNAGRGEERGESGRGRGGGDRDARDDRVHVEGDGGDRGGAGRDGEDRRKRAREDGLCGSDRAGREDRRRERTGRGSGDGGNGSGSGADGGRGADDAGSGGDHGAHRDAAEATGAGTNKRGHLVM